MQQVDLIWNDYKFEYQILRGEVHDAKYVASTFHFESTQRRKPYSTLPAGPPGATGSGNCITVEVVLLVSQIFGIVRLTRNTSRELDFYPMTYPHPAST